MTAKGSPWHDATEGTESLPYDQGHVPGQYPRTPERATAAKKYNMRMEDYEPYPDDGMEHGDYPMLPNHSRIGIHGMNGTTET
ncbi:hypothetical protein STEG23_006140 [Scotinomys teguina]